MHNFWALSYEVSLVAPRQMTLAATLLTERTRRAIITTGKESEHKEAMERVREMRALFLDAGRRDLGIDTELLLKAHVAEKKSAETPPSSSAAG